MWARIEDGEIVQTISSPKSIVVNHVHHPKAILCLLGQMKNEKQ